MAPRNAPPRGPQLELAGELSVAFVNTAGARPNNRQLGVGSHADLLVWGRQVDLLSTAEAERLGQRADAEPEIAAATYARVDGTRSALARTFLAISRQRQPADADLATVNRTLAAALPAMRLISADTGVTVAWAGEEDFLGHVLGPVLYSAVTFLPSLEGQPHVRQCAGKDCALFFVDRSRSGRRSWCEMKTCGHRINSLRYYHRRGKDIRIKPWRH